MTYLIMSLVHFEELRQLFQRCNIVIILVFDGANHPLKRITQAERKVKREKAEKDLEQFEQSQTIYSENSLNKILKNLVAPSPAVFAAVREWALKCNITCYSAPFEADWQLGYLFNEKIIDFALSKDGDILVHGVTVMKELNISKGEALLYKFSDLQGMMQ